MGDRIDRIKRDRALYARGAQNQLFSLIAQGDPRKLTGAVTRLIELKVICEEIAVERGIEIDARVIAEYIEENREHVEEQVRREVTSFISSIVSQEG